MMEEIPGFVVPEQQTGWVGEWLLKECETEPVGFVYIITRMTDGKFYIGKKLMRFKRTRKPLKGKRFKRHYTVESDWKTYWGSSNELLADIEKLGKSSFRRSILCVCYSKHDLAYQELRMQLAKDVMNPYVNTYNGILNVRLRKLQPKKEVPQ
jgi:hypothetical protein